MATATRQWKQTEYWGHDVEVRPGRYVKADRWQLGRIIRADESEFATYRMPLENGGPIESLACNIEVTGRTVQRRDGGGLWVRVKITFPGDCEPDTVTGGWMLVKSWLD
jgi:hypothetical protein